MVVFFIRPRQISGNHLTTGKSKNSNKSELSFLQSLTVISAICFSITSEL
jgi:hypothetical protein